MSTDVAGSALETCSACYSSDNWGTSIQVAIRFGNMVTLLGSGRASHDLSVGHSNIRCDRVLNPPPGRYSRNRRGLSSAPTLVYPTTVLGYETTSDPFLHQ